jgi:Holliday junction resolvase-like predicted endonuclease
MKALGIEGEDLAVKFLRKIGYKIVAKNYKTQIGEIDIIARDCETTVFIEVKTRTNDSFGYPFEAVHSGKKTEVEKFGSVVPQETGQGTSGQIRCPQHPLRGKRQERDRAYQGCLRGLRLISNQVLTVIRKSVDLVYLCNSHSTERDSENRGVFFYLNDG